MKKTILTGLCALFVATGTARAQNTGFTYQGRLNSANGAATGLYDFSFNLHATGSGGSALTTALTTNAVPVTNGLFAVTLDFGNQFPGADRWLEIAVRTNGVGAFATLAPRQPLTPTPYAIRAASAGTATTAATATTATTAGIANSVSAGAVNGAALAGNAVDSSKIADGSVTANDLSPAVLSNTFWRLTGNAGTTPGVNFLGTIDNQAVEVKANNARVWRAEPNAASPNLIGGFPGNIISNGVAGGVIAGGGFVNNTNRVGGSYSTVGGGYNNAAYFGSATVAGGDNNLAAQDRATVGGGFSNRAIGLLSTVAGGDNNTASGQFSTVPGGSFSTAGADYAMASGRRAKATTAGAFVWADSQNADFGSTSNNQFLVRAAGGLGLNTNNPQEALHVNGRYIRVDGLGNERVYIGGDGVSSDVQLGSLNGAVSNVTLWNPTAGRRMNLELDRLDAYSANISGPLTANLSNATFTATAGSPPFGVNGNATKVPSLNADQLDGFDSSAFWKTTGNAGTSAGANFVGTTDNQPFEARVNNQRVLRFELLFAPGNSPNLIGGFSGNSVSGVIGAAIGGGGAAGFPNRVNANYGVVAGGLGNSVFQNDSFIGGGIGNNISTDRAVIAGGRDNSVRTNASNAAIGGGRDNVVTGAHGAIPGGISNEATNNAFAAGTRAKAIRPGTFVWADSQNVDFSSTASDQFLVRASGGAGFGTRTPTAQLDVSSTGGDSFPQLRIDHTTGSDYARLRFTQRGNYSHRWDLGAVSNSFILYSGYFGREFLHADGNGVSFGDNHVGIGTATPTSKFTVQGSAIGGFVSPLAYIENTNTEGNSGPALRVKGAGNPLDGVLSVSSHGIGLIARFGNANNWVSSLDTNGNWCGTTFSTCSDRNVKENFAPVDPKEVLEKVAALPISTWNYLQDTGSKHIGPMSQDFWAAFGAGVDDKHITSVDADGVALAAIQGLNEIVREKTVRIDSLEQKNSALESRLLDLEILVRQLARPATDH